MRMRMIHSDVLLIPSSSNVQLVSILNQFERAVELVAGVSFTDISHKRTSICSRYRKRRKKSARQKEQP
jgi:hypothetical protein